VGLPVDPDFLAGDDDVDMPSGGSLTILPAALVPSTSTAAVDGSPFGSVTESGVSLDNFADPGWTANPRGMTVLPADYQSGPVQLTGSTCTPPWDTKEFTAHGCMTIYRLTNESDPDKSYFVHDFQATGNAKGNYKLYRLKWRDESGKTKSGNYVYTELKRSPNGNEDQGSCFTASASLPVLGASFGASWQVCAAYIHPWNSATLFHSSWISHTQGQQGSNPQAETDGDSEWSGPNADTKGYAVNDSLWVYINS
jgi:hypothetical protein